MKPLDIKNIKKLEDKMTKYKHLLKVETKENQEKFVKLDKKLIPSSYILKLNDMQSMLNNEIIIRKSINGKLIKIQSKLQKVNSSYSLFITYGYRDLETQTKYFLDQLRLISKKMFFPKAIDLYEEVHRYIAVPSVAGHPTGGAIDVLIIDKKSKKSLDFGSLIYDFSTKKSLTFYPKISVEAKKNRLLLRELMIKEGFAPFDGEWWHFSYGDREWAFFYKKKFAIYDQVKLMDLKL